MKKLIGFFATMAAVITLTAQTANAVVHTIDIELSYSGTATGYNLYQDGIKVYHGYGDATTLTAAVPITAKTHTFVLTAEDANGVESPQSSPYVLTIPDPTFKCVEPVNPTVSANRVDFFFNSCTDVPKYRVLTKDAADVIVSNDIVSTPYLQKDLPPGDYKSYITLLDATGADLWSYVYGPFSYTIPPPPAPLPPQAAIALVGLADASMKAIITAKSGDVGVTEFHYTIYARDANNNVKAFFANDMSVKGAGNYVGTLNLTGKRGVIVEVRAYNPTTRLESDPTIVVAQIGDLNGDRLVTSTDQTAWNAQRGKVSAIWNINTRDLISSPLTALEKADLNNNGIVGAGADYVGGQYLDLNFIRTHLKVSPNPQAVTPLAP